MWWQRIAADLGYSVHGLLKRPLFSAVVVLTLALGIGVNVAVYSFFSTLLLRPLPVLEPDRLVNLSSPGQLAKRWSCNAAGTCDAVFSYPMFRDIESVDGPFTGVAAHSYVDASIGWNGATFAGRAVLVSGSYFPVLGVTPALGRLLGPADDAVDGEAAAAVLSYDYWRNALAGDPDVVGKTIAVNGKPLTVVGVAPREFKGTTVTSRPQVFVPLTLRSRAAAGEPDPFDDRRNHWLYLFARLEPGGSVDAASAAMNARYRAILTEIEAPLLTDVSEQQRAAFTTRSLLLEPGDRGQSLAAQNGWAPLMLLLGATAMVLLIACVNIANLMLVRGAARTGEIAIRVSLGASAARIVTLLLVEVLLLASLGAILSLPVTLAVIHGMLAMLPVAGAGVFDLGIDAEVLLATAALAAAAAAVFGIVPARKLVGRASDGVLRAESTRTMSSKGAGRARAVLTTAQVALSMALLVVAGWFAQSLANLWRADLGIRPESLVTFELSPERNGYAAEESRAVFERLEAELRALPGAASVGAAQMPIVDSRSRYTSLSVEGYEPRDGAAPSAYFNAVTAQYFETVGMPLLTGTGFANAAAAPTPRIAIVNARFVERFGLGANPIGKRIALTENAPPDVEIVGVVRDAKYANVKEIVEPQVFVPSVQAGDRSLGFMSFYVRSAADPVVLRAAIGEIVARIDANLPVVRLRTVESVIRDNLFIDRFIGTLAGGLAALAVILASIGLYGVLSYNIAQRTRELGLRLALGAAPRNLRFMVLRQVAVIGVTGAVIGLGVALLLGRAAGALLYGLTVTDPAVLAAAAATLAVVIAAAAYVPARRASRADPMTALRSE